MIKAFIFDFDGVIVDSLEIKTKAFAKLFEDEGEEIVKEVTNYHLNNTGISRYEKFEHIYKEILKKPLFQKKLRELCNKFENLVVDNVIKAPYIKGAKEFLEEYSSKLQCFIVSATPQKEIEEIIKKRDIHRFFVRVYGAPTKKTEAVKEILLKENLTPINAIYIGDAISDYNAANTNSVRFIALVSPGNTVFSKIDCYKIKDLTQLDTFFGLL